MSICAGNSLVPKGARLIRATGTRTGRITPGRKARQQDGGAGNYVPVPAALPLARFPARPVASRFVTGLTLAPVLPVRLEIRFVAAIHRVRGACRVIAVEVERSFGAEHDLMRGLFRRPVERRDPLAGRVLQLIGDLPGIVRDQLGTVPRPACAPQKLDPT